MTMTTSAVWHVPTTKFHLHPLASAIVSLHLYLQVSYCIPKVTHRHAPTLSNVTVMNNGGNTTTPPPQCYHHHYSHHRYACLLTHLHSHVDHPTALQHAHGDNVFTVTQLTGMWAHTHFSCTHFLLTYMHPLWATTTTMKTTTTTAITNTSQHHMTTTNK